MILLDSNIWIYFLDQKAKEHERVVRELRPLADEPLLVPTLVQVEVIHHLMRRLSEAAEPIVETFLAQESEVVALTPDVVGEGWRLLLAHQSEGIGSRDVCILAVARRRGATLMTNDRALAESARALGIETRNPARADLT